MLPDFASPYGLWVILGFFFLHWFGSAFSQTFFLHRYASHGMFSMNRFWERVFYGLTFLSQGSSFLNPRAYAILHRMHHAYSDTEKDPHSPHFFRDVIQMMLQTKRIYQDLLHRRGHYPHAARFDRNYPEWPLLDRIGDSWAVRVFWGFGYAVVHLLFAPSWWLFLLLPVHFLMGPVHGAVVNWCGHKYGYRNYKLGDHSRNSSPWDILLLGELFQNNHHHDPLAVKFARRWWEFDLTYPLIRLLGALRIITLTKPASTPQG